MPWDKRVTYHQSYVNPFQCKAIILWEYKEDFVLFCSKSLSHHIRAYLFVVY